MVTYYIDSLERAIPQKKQQQIALYRVSLTPAALAKANLSKGRGIFKQQCAKCHFLDGVSRCLEGSILMTSLGFDLFIALRVSMH